MFLHTLRKIPSPYTRYSYSRRTVHNRILCLSLRVVIRILGFPGSEGILYEFPVQPRRIILLSTVFTSRCCKGIPNIFETSKPPRSRRRKPRASRRPDGESHVLLIFNFRLVDLSPLFTFTPIISCRSRGAVSARDFSVASWRRKLRKFRNHRETVAMTNIFNIPAATLHAV